MKTFIKYMIGSYIVMIVMFMAIDFFGDKQITPPFCSEEEIRTNWGQNTNMDCEVSAKTTYGVTLAIAILIGLGCWAETGCKSEKEEKEEEKA